MRQVWTDLLFMHWEADESDLQSRLPQRVELDLFDGKPWLGVIPFDMHGIAPRGGPAIPLLGDFPELNVRTYVRVDDKPGVWFFSLDVPRVDAVWGARTFFHLPYYLAAMRVRREKFGIDYKSARRDRALDITYRPGEEKTVSPDSFLHWATSRYCLYCQNRRGDLFRGNIHHAPWSLSDVDVDFRQNSMCDPFVTGDRHPDMAYASELPVVIYPLEKIPV